MARYESITYSRQDAFDVERDMRCDPPFEMVDEDATAEKMAYYLSGKGAALIGEFSISKKGREQIIRKASEVLEILCSGKEQQCWLSKSRSEIMDKHILSTACVLLVRNSVIAAEREQRSEPSEVWPLILDGLGFSEIAKKTGCNKQAARNYLCDILEETIDLFIDGGKKYYNTLRLHALAPEGSIQDLYDQLYTFYRENLESTYEPGTNAASMFVEAMRQRREKTAVFGLASSQRELFLRRPKYTAALCDALLERIDWIVQGDMTRLDNKSRWDILLRGWYKKKSETEKRRMMNERKAVIRSKIVDSPENIRPEYRFEDGKLCICIPGIRLPEIQQSPVLQLFQGSMLICEKKLPIYGSELLYHTRASRVVLDQELKINWKMQFLFEIRIHAGEKEIYRSGSRLHKDYLCFTAGGNETRLIRSEQQLRLILRKKAKLQIDDPEQRYSIENKPYRCIVLRTSAVGSVLVNGTECLEEAYGTGKPWIYLTPEEDSSVYAKNGEETVLVYNCQPLLRVRTENRTEGKNYQLTIDGTVQQLYEFPWTGACFEVRLPEEQGVCHQVVLKEFGSGNVLEQRSYIVVSGLHLEFDKAFYLDKEVTGSLTIGTDMNWIVQPFHLEPGENRVFWQMNGLSFECEVPKICAELDGKNAFLLPEHMWHQTMRNSFLTIRGPESVRWEVVLGSHFLFQNSDGSYEIGTELMKYSHAMEDALLGLLILGDSGSTEEKLTQIHCQEALLSDPVRQEGRKILWQPDADTFIGGETPVFEIVLENDQGSPWTYQMYMVSDKIEANFPCHTGIYSYEVWLTERKNGFQQLPKLKLLTGEIAVEDPPENRFRDEYIILTHAYYDHPLTQKEVMNKMMRNAAEIDDIRYVKTLTENEEKQHVYTGNLYFRTKYSSHRFSDVETALYLKINPVFFSPEPDGTLRVWKEDGESLELNLMGLENSPFDTHYGIQIFSRKKDLDTREKQEKYWACAEYFRYREC